MNIYVKMQLDEIWRLKQLIKPLNRQIKTMQMMINAADKNIEIYEYLRKSMLNSGSYEDAKSVSKSIRYHQKISNDLSEVRATIVLQRNELGDECIRARNIIVIERKRNVVLQKLKTTNDFTGLPF